MLKIDIEDKIIQDLVAKINYKVENELYESLRELHTDYFLLNGYITIYTYDTSNYNVNIVDFIDKLPRNFPEYNEDVFKCRLEETKHESNE